MAALLQGVTGSLGACVATTVTYPIEIVRTRIQAGKTGGNTGLLAVFLYILKKEGFFGFFNGLSSQYIQTSLANFLFFYFYSHFRRMATNLLIKQVRIVYLSHHKIIKCFYRRLNSKIQKILVKG